MTKIIFLLPPSEWKNSENTFEKEKLKFNFDKPYEIAINATGKDLKCSWKRFEEWILLNKNIFKSNTIETISRYSGVMYNAIDYSWKTDNWKHFFEKHFLILSGMYGIISPLDHIWNYKLPIETKWLYNFWWNKISMKLVELNPDYIVNLLPDSYAKLIWIWKSSKLENLRNIYTNNWTKIININFLKPDFKKISHWVKKIKGEWIKEICEKNIINYEQFWWEIIKNWNILDINIIVDKV